MGLLFCRGCGINQFGTSTRTPQSHVLNTFQYIDNLIWNRGRHSLKMGVSVSRFQYNFRNFARLQGTYQFDDLRRFMQGTFTAATVFFGDLESEIPQPLGLRQTLVGIYLQDDLQVRPNLTLNLGVRYEFITNPTEVAGRLGNLDNPLDCLGSHRQWQVLGPGRLWSLPPADSPMVLQFGTLSQLAFWHSRGAR
jgi:outer membrane receptor protein involved in Fe transport